MDAKTSDWQPGPTVCRCCFTEGCYKDISTEYFWMGKREVYAEMLSETFSVSISYSKSGGPNSHSRLICEQCISRLRDAADFRRQVVECEKMFIQHLDPCTSSVEIPAVVLEPPEKEVVKLERVKLEKEASDEEFDDRGFPDDDDDDDDDMDDEPLMKLATKIPKKETMDLRELLSNSKLVLKRKAPATKTKPTVPAKKLKSKKEVKPAGSKAAAKPAPKPVEKKKKDNEPMFIARRNAKVIVQYATVYPFRLPECAMGCVFCESSYEDPAQFREHVNTAHNKFNVKDAFWHVRPCYYLKVDCTELSCRICSETFNKLDEIAVHLNTHAQCNVDLNYDLGLQPFILYKDRYTCAICDSKGLTIRGLSRHMQTHYVKFTCETCGKPYASSESLRTHTLTAHAGDKKCLCRKCMKYFSSPEERRQHLTESPSCWPRLCRVCGERFMMESQKKQHLETVHGSKPMYACPECPKVYSNKTQRRKHFVICHTDKRISCPYCEKKCWTKRNLAEHIVVHTSEKSFVCTVCSKSFLRKSYLTQHMWVHSEIKRFECTLCKKQFVHKISWKAHMQCCHPDQVVSV